MKVIEVLPITRGVFKKKLTYFTSKNVGIGAIVSVPIRGHDVLSLVIETKTIERAKTGVKKLDYGLKKITSIKSDSFFSGEFLKTVNDTSKHFLCNSGQVIEYFSPKNILENSEKIEVKERINTLKENSKIEKIAIQNHFDERASFYKSIVRENFAAKKSVFVCLPTINGVEKMFSQLEKGVSDFSVILHGDISKKEMLDGWIKAVNSKHPMLIVATPQFLSLPRSDMGTIILDEENDRSYKQMTRPFIDVRAFAEKLAQNLGAKIILGDIILRIETISKLEQKEFYPGPSFKNRYIFPGESFIVENKKIGEKKHLPILSSEMEEFLVYAGQQKEKTFLLCGRKGLYPNTVCGDCGESVQCDTCDSHLSLKETNKIRNFVCYKCHKKYEVLDKCKNCGSWKLATLGAGIESIRREVEKIVSKENIYQIDSDVVKSRKQAKKIMKEFMSSKKGVLLGTEKTLSYLEEKIENVGVLSIDSWLSIPDFSIKDKIIKIIVALNFLANKRFVLQTRNPGESVYKYGTSGLISDFFKEELGTREKFKYPPFYKLIKIRLDKKNLAELEDLKEELIKQNPLNEYFIIEDAGNKTSVLIIKIIRGKKLEEPFKQILLSLPPSFIINVDPENVL